SAAVPVRESKKGSTWQESPSASGLRYHDKASAPGAQTERRGVAGPVTDLCSGSTSPAAWLSHHKDTTRTKIGGELLSRTCSGCGSPVGASPYGGAAVRGGAGAGPALPTAVSALANRVCAPRAYSPCPCAAYARCGGPGFATGLRRWQSWAASQGVVPLALR